MNLRVALLGVLMLACASPPHRAPPEKPGDAISDRSLGLSKTSVFATASPPAFQENPTVPGERAVIPRAYLGAPPRIPHGVADLLPITAEENACIGCHQVKKKLPGRPTPIPPSHFTDLRRAPEQPGTSVVGARYLCVSCHVPVSDAPPLVESRFAP